MATDSRSNHFNRIENRHCTLTTSFGHWAISASELRSNTFKNKSIRKLNNKYPPILPRSLRAWRVAWPFVFFTIPKIWQYLLNHLFLSFPSILSSSKFSQFPQFSHPLILSIVWEFLKGQGTRPPDPLKSVFCPFAYHTYHTIPYIPYGWMGFPQIPPNTIKYNQMQPILPRSFGWWKYEDS